MKLLNRMLSWIFTIGIAFAIALFVGIFIFQPYNVEGHSMDPTLHDQERIYTTKFVHTFSYLPDYGDIVIIDSRIERKRSFRDNVLENPIIQLIAGGKDERIFYVKRVIGKPGDVLEFKNHKVYRNGKPLDEPYIKETMNYSSPRKWVVPQKHIFVMGDNRNHSEDSRSIGYIPLDHVLGVKL